MSQVPTVGRRMWYKQSPADASIDGLLAMDSQQPFDAGVVYVHGNGLSVNLVVTDHEGTQRVRDGVEIWQGDWETCPEGYVCWMPYQKKQHEQQRVL